MSALFLIPAIPMVLTMAVGMHAAWSKADTGRLQKRLVPVAIASVVLGIALPLVVWGYSSVLFVLGAISAFWLMISSLLAPGKWLLERRTLRGYPRSMLGMCLAHFGVGIFVLGVAVTSAFSDERDLSMSPGQVIDVSGYEFELTGTREVRGPNYDAVEAELVVRRDGEVVTVLNPQKRVYRVQRNPMTEAALHPRLSRDLYVAMGEPLGEGAWSVRLQYKPLIRFIWLGCIIMALGGVVAMSDRRYRLKREAEAPETTGAEVTV